MTLIVVNAISIKEGGSLVVLRALLREMATLRPLWQWVVVINSSVQNNLPDCQNILYKCFPNVERSGLRTRLWYEMELQTLLKCTSADLLFSMTNYLPLRRAPCQTLLLVQHAGHFSPIFKLLTENRLGLIGRVAWRIKGYWVKSSIRAADIVTVQTSALARQILKEINVPSEHIKVVAHGAGQSVLQSSSIIPPVYGEKLRIGFITGYGVQKNFIVLFKALATLKGRGISVTLVITLSERLPENKALLVTARHLGIGDLIENYGEQAPNEINQLYASLHVFVFPSLCESLGLPMAEAMAYGLPLLVADIDSNIEVAGNGAEVFPAHDFETLALQLERLATDSAWFKKRASASLDRGKEFDWRQAAEDTLFLMEILLSDKRAESEHFSNP